MVIIMEMHAGNVIGNPDEYGDEVLNASWLPPQPEPALPLQHAGRGEGAGNRPPPLDVDDFLQAVYRYQE